MKNIKNLLSLTAAVVAMGAVFFSCDSLFDDNGGGDTGNLSVLLTDGPFPSDMVAEANITIDSLDIREKGAQDTTGAYTTISREQATYNLMDLRNGVTESLANLDVPEGIYNQVRLYVSDAKVVLKDGQEFPLQVPSGVRTGLKIFIRPDIEVQSGITAELLLDIDVSKSFVVQGDSKGPGGITGFLFKPVLRAVNQSTAGRLAGTVTDTSAAANPIADAQVWVELDSVISSTFTDTLTGDYQLIALPAGFYTAYATVAGHDTVSFTNVEIIAATATDLNFALTAEQLPSDGLVDEDTGTLTVLLTDGPFPADLVAEANITIDSLDIREKDTQDETGAYTTLSSEPGTYNLMDLRNGVTESLVDLDIPEGTYNQVRLYVSDAKVVLKDGQEFPLQVPSGVRTGLKIFIRPDIEVQSGITAELLLDIDVSKSFVVQGDSKGPGGITGFLFKPVLRAVNQSTAGRLAGTVTDTSAAANPIADAQVWVELDSVISSTFTDTLTGDYQLIALPAEFYTAHATVAGHDTVSFTNVEIIAATATDLNFALTPLPEE